MPNGDLTTLPSLKLGSLFKIM